MATSGLTPPGSATYDSGTMYVGDGTWDSKDNTFLLPNLQGLNYDTMRYNGMGNRFKDFPGYYGMVVGHGVLAAITFLLIVPIAIMVNRFYWRSYYWKMRVHIWAQILTVFFSTAIIILGFNQVGPRRSLTNPHHVIGLTLYILILVQFIGGYLNHKRSKGAPHGRRLLRIVLHQWLGRTIGLLGIIQVALGLTLYGSPLSLFVLYALMVFALLLAYFIFDFVNDTGTAQHQTGNASYYSGTEGPPPDKPGHKFGFLKGALAAGGAAALLSRLRKKKNHGSNYGSEVYSETYSAHPSRPGRRPGAPTATSYASGDEYSEYDEKPGAKKHTWRDRLLGVGAAGGLAYWLNKRKKAKEPSVYDDDDRTSYMYSDTDGALSRIEEGRPLTPATPGRPTGSASQTPNSQDRLTRPTGHRPTHSEMSESSYMSGSPSKYRPRHPVRDGLFGLGAIGAAKGLFDWRKRRERKEQRRIEELRRQEAEDEIVQRRQSTKYTGDGSPRRGGRHSRLPGGVPSTIPGSVNPSQAGTGAGAALGAGAAAAAAAAPYPSGGAYPSAHSAAVPHMAGALAQSTTSLAPPPPIHSPGTATYPSQSRPSTAGGLSQSYVGGSPADTAAAGLAGGAAGAALGAAAAGRDRRSRDNSRVRRSNEASPATPVSVKLNMHPDGRHVTLRRLTEEEAAKERESKRTRNRSRRRRAGSGGEGSMVSDIATTPDTRRRRPGQGVSPSGAPRPGYAASSAAGSAVPPSTSYPTVPRPSSNLPPSGTVSPMPYPAPGQAPMHAPGFNQAGMSAASLHPPPSVSTLPGRRPSGVGIMSHPGSVSSPVYDAATDTQESQMSAFAENRRRRRAQRAQANLAKQQKEGDNRSVDFE